MRRRGPVILLLLGLVFVALNLRLALTSVGPLIDVMRADLGVSAAVVGLLTTAPLLAFGIVAPFAPRLAERFGTERLVLFCVMAIGTGVALRLAPPLVFLFGGTLIAGVGIAIGNVLLPGIVKGRFGDRAAFMTGVYSVALTAGAAIAAGLTVPIERLVDDWRLALAFWALPAIVAAFLWLPQVRWRAEQDAAAAARAGDAGAGAADGRLPGTPGAAPARERVRLWRDRRAWQVSIAMGLQSLIFYVTVAWLPELLRDLGPMSSGRAGAYASLAMALGIPAGLAMSVAAGRMRDQRPLGALVVGATIVGWIGLLLAADVAPLLWSLILGIGEGGCFTLVMTLFVLRARDARHAAELSGMAQSVGYTLAALGPLAIGALHDANGGWEVPLAVMLGFTCLQLLTMLTACRPGFVGGDPAPSPSTGRPAAAISR